MTGATDFYANQSSANISRQLTSSGKIQISATSDVSEEYNTRDFSGDNSMMSPAVEFMLPEKRPREATMSQMIFSRQFMLLYFMNAMSIMTGYFAVNNFKTYGQANGLTNDGYLVILGSAAAVCNSMRFLWSWVTDYLPYKIVYSFMLCLQILLNFTIKLVAKNEIFYAIWISSMLFCEGGHFTLVPNVLKKIYGEKATQLYGILFSYTGVCAIALILL